MKKKLVAFAVTAAMVVTSAVPVFAWSPDGGRLDTSNNQIIVNEDGTLPGGAVETEGVAGAITSGKTFSSVVDLNRTTTPFEYVLNLSNGRNVDDMIKVLVGSDRVASLVYDGQVVKQAQLADGIFEFTWTFTEVEGDMWLDVVIDNLGTTANTADYTLQIQVNENMTTVDSLALNGVDSDLVSDKADLSGQVVLFKEAPSDIVGVEVIKVTSDCTPILDHGKYVVATQPVKGEYYYINSITLNDGTVIDGTDFDKYATVEWTAKKANGTVVYTGDPDTKQNSDNRFFGVNTNGYYDGCVINAVVSAKKGSGVFDTVVWGADSEALAVQERLAGANRYETAMEVADQMKDSNGFENIFVATGETYADALSATALANELDAPILLVNQYYEEAVKAYIDANAADYDATVYIIGGTGAVSADFEASLKRYNVDVERLAGANRYDTNLAILRAYNEVTEVNWTEGMRHMLVASGQDYADALSASATGLPILLVGDVLTPAQRDFLRNELVADFSTGTNYAVKDYTIIGGTAAVSRNIQSELSGKSYIADADRVTRLGGDDRYETNRKVVNTLMKDNKASAKYVFVASGDNFPDALAGGVLAAQNGCPIVLVNQYNTAIAKTLVNSVEKANPNGFGGLVVVGGEGVISNELVQKIA